MVGREPTPPQCKATAKSTRERCGRTSMRGQEVCQVHGGSTKAAKAKAAERIAQARADALVQDLVWNTDAAPVTDSLTALQQLAGRLGAAVDRLGSLVGDGEGLNRVVAGAWLQVITQQRQLLTDMERLGIATRAAEVDAATLRHLAAGVDALLDHLGLQGEARLEAVQVLMGKLMIEQQTVRGAVA